MTLLADADAAALLEAFEPFPVRPDAAAVAVADDDDEDDVAADPEVFS